MDLSRDWRANRARKRGRGDRTSGSEGTRIEWGEIQQFWSRRHGRAHAERRTSVRVAGARPQDAARERGGRGRHGARNQRTVRYHGRARSRSVLHDEGKLSRGRDELRRTRKRKELRRHRARLARGDARGPRKDRLDVALGRAAIHPHARRAQTRGLGASEDDRQHVLRAHPWISRLLHPASSHASGHVRQRVRARRRRAHRPQSGRLTRLQGRDHSTRRHRDQRRLESQRRSSRRLE